MHFCMQNDLLSAFGGGTDADGPDLLSGVGFVDDRLVIDVSGRDVERSGIHPRVGAGRSDSMARF